MHIIIKKTHTAPTEKPTLYSILKASTYQASFLHEMTNQSIAKAIKINRTVVQETGAFRHHGGQIEGLKPLGPSQHTIVLRGSKGPLIRPQLYRETAVSIMFCCL